jgi:hypothetical protein
VFHLLQRTLHSPEGFKFLSSRAFVDRRQLVTPCGLGDIAIRYKEHWVGEASPEIIVKTIRGSAVLKR